MGKIHTITDLKLKIDIFHNILLSYKRNILCRKPLNQLIKRSTFRPNSFINLLISKDLNFFHVRGYHKNCGKNARNHHVW